MCVPQANLLPLVCLVSMLSPFIVLGKSRNSLLFALEAAASTTTTTAVATTYRIAGYTFKGNYLVDSMTLPTNILFPYPQYTCYYSCTTLELITRRKNNKLYYSFKNKLFRLQNI